MKIAVIPARGGSKRIAKKNIKPFNGRPIISWSIEAAKNSKLFEKVIVSTDSEEIAEVALHYGAEVPFLRPENLADDYTGTSEVVAHAIGWHLEHGYSIQSACCIYATAPLIRLSDILNAFEIFNTDRWNYVFPATEFSSSIFRGFERAQLGGVQMLYPNHFATRSQDLKKIFHDAGQFYWGKANAWLEGRPIFDNDSTVIAIPPWRVQDIDTHEDWERAEIIASILDKGNG